MQVRATFLVLAVILVATTESKPLWSNVYLNNYQHPSAAINAQPQLLQYQDAYPSYYVYNIHTDLKAVPATVLANGKPALSHVPGYNLYYGTPVYDFRFPLNPVYPVLTPSHPGFLPKPTPPPTSTVRPFDDDGIEKLDTQVDPDMQKPGQSDGSEDDSVVIEAI